MNLHLTYKNNIIENFINIDLFSDKYEEQVKQIPHSSCSNIIITEVVNVLTYAKSIDILNEAVSKLRKGGNITLSLIDFDAICTNYINGNIEPNYLGSILQNINSAIPIGEIIQIVKNRNITIVNIQKRDFLTIIHGNRDNQ